MHEFDIASDWPRALEDILARARTLGSRAVVAFDLDSTVFDNRPRQARIIREFGQAFGIPELTRCKGEFFDSGWDMRAAFRNCGLSREETDRVFPKARTFWVERFFTGPYCLEDEAIDGAGEFLTRVAESGAQLAYVTGRHEEMREGSVGCMQRHGYPLPDGRRVHLLMKPKLELNDDAHKREAHARLGDLGQVIAAFDNEPTHANDYRRKFPEATVVHLATDHSGRPVRLLDGILSIPHFHY
jgi:beta-phosphoglucomutase-like phosphatase (HAD superfamily)